MAAPDIESFLSTLRKSNLLDGGHWRQLTERMADRAGRGMPSVEELSRELIRDAWLTAWQVEHLQAGRHSFFLGRYKLLEQIGSGGMGAVFRAEQVGLHRVVALKLLAPDLVRDPAALKRFHQEIQAVAAVDHPNVVTAYDADAVGETHFLVMQYVAGKSLAEMLVERGPAPVNWACECIRQVSEGLQHAWERGLVHRDIKPSNLLVIPESTGSSANLTSGTAAASLTIKILDLGLARLVSEQGDEQGLTQTGQVLGTPDYISPEQATDTRSADIRSDLFSLGVTFHRLLTGELPFTGTSVMEKLMARATQTPPSVRTLRSDVPEAIARIVLRLLERDPAKRFQTPKELARALAPYCRQVSTSSWIPRDFERARERLLSDAPANEPSTMVDQILARVATAVPLAPRETGALLSTGQSTDAAAAASRPQVELSRPADAGRETRRRSQFRRVAGLQPRILVFGAMLLTVLGGLTWWLNRTGSPRPAQLVVSWPLHQRQGALLLVNGKELGFGPEPDVVWEGPPGRHRMRAVRPGFPAIDTALELTAGKVSRWSPDWAAAEQSWFEEMRARIDNQRARLGSASAETAAPTRELMLSVLDRAPRGRAGQQLARDLSTVRWPLDELGTIELTDEQSRLLGRPTVDGAAVGTESRQILALFGDPRWRHAGTIVAVGISAARQSILTAGTDGFVRLWGFDGRLQAELSYQSREARIVVSPLGDHALVCGGSSALLLSIPGGEQVASYPGVLPVGGFSRDGRRLTLAHATEGMAVVPVERATSVQWLAVPTASQITRLAPSHDGELVAVERGRATEVYRASGESVDFGETGDVNAPLWHPERSVLAVQRDSGDAALLDCSTTPPVVTLLEDAGEPLGFVAGGTRLISRRNQRATLWEIAPAREVRTLQDVVGQVKVIADPPAIVTGDESFGWLRLRSFERSVDLSIPAHVGPLSGLAVSEDSRWVGTGGADGRLRFWNAETLAERTAADAGVVSACLTPDGRQILLGSDDGAIRIWDVAARQASRTLVTGARELRELAVSPGGRFMAAIGDWGFFKVSPRVWDASTGAEIILSGDPVSGVRAMRFSGDGDQVALLTDRGLVRAWSLPEGQPREQVDLAISSVEDLAVEPRGLRKAVLSRGGLAWWDGSTAVVHQKPMPPGTALARFGAWTDDVWLLSQDSVYRGGLAEDRRWEPRGRIPSATAWAFDPAEDRVAIGTASGTVNVLSLGALSQGAAEGTTGGATDNWPPEWRVPGRGPIRSVEFSSDGRHLLIVGSGGVALLMRLESFDSR